jgi:hypothetical protein
MTTYFVKADEVGATIETALYDQNGALDLSLPTDIQFIVSESVEGENVITGDADVVDQGEDVTPRYVARYTFEEGDLEDRFGLYPCEWKLTYAGGVVRRVPTVGYDYLSVNRQLA